MKTKTITLSKGGSDERTVPIGQITIPDLWHLADSIRVQVDDVAAEMVLEVWHLAHDFKRHIEENR